MIHIDVTQDHIDRGTTYSRSCPIALAICEELGIGEPKVWVSTTQMSISLPKNVFFLSIPSEMREWIRTNDERKTWENYKLREEPPAPKPFSFDIDPETRKVVNVG